MDPLFRLPDLASLRLGRWQGELPSVLRGRDTLLEEFFQARGAWGIDSAIDLFTCDPVAIRDEGTIRAFVQAFCEHFALRCYGELRLEHFGEDARVSGYSLSQWIETSELSAHFLNQANAVCLNLFSCQSYPPYQAAAFCQEWFRAREVELTVTFRGPQAAPPMSFPSIPSGEEQA